MHFGTDKAVVKRQKMEAAIVRRVVRDALAAGWTLTVDTGGDEPDLESSTKYSEVISALMETDEDLLILRRAVAGPDGLEHKSGWVRFVYGNEGWTVIADNTSNLDELLKGAEALAERLEARAR